MLSWNYDVCLMLMSSISLRFHFIKLKIEMIVCFSRIWHCERSYQVCDKKLWSQVLDQFQNLNCCNVNGQTTKRQWIFISFQCFYCMQLHNPIQTQIPHSLICCILLLSISTLQCATNFAPISNIRCTNWVNKSNRNWAHP